jgi:Fe-S cluster assembly iron-binding protein IscA
MKNMFVNRDTVKKITTMSEIDNMLANENMKCVLIVDTSDTELLREYNISYTVGNSVHGFEFENVRNMEKTIIFGEDFADFVPLNNILVITPTMNRILKALSVLFGK